MEKKKYVMKTNLKWRHQVGNEDRSDKWLEGAENNDRQCGSKTAFGRNMMVRNGHNKF